MQIVSHSLASDEDGVVCALKDKQGKVRRVDYCFGSGETATYLFDAQDKARLSASLSSEGAAAFSLYDSAARPRYEATVNRSDLVGQAFYSESGDCKASTTVARPPTTWKRVQPPRPGRTTRTRAT